MRRTEALNIAFHNPYRFGFNGQEKDNDVTGKDATHTTAMFWEYDSRLGRRWNLDPKPTTSVSSYSCLNNSPLVFLDPNGDTVIGDIDAYNQVKSFVQIKITALENSISEVKTQISNNASGGKSVKGLERRLSKLESEKSSFQNIADEYSMLEESTQIYNIVTGGDPPAGSGGVTRFNSTTNNVDVIVNNVHPLLNSLPHELKHAFQFETLKLDFPYSGTGGGAFYDLTDEVEAFNRSKMFGFYVGENINKSWVRQHGYMSLPMNPISAATQAYPGAPTYGEQMKLGIYYSGVNGNCPRFVIKDWQIYFNQGASALPFPQQ